MIIQIYFNGNKTEDSSFFYVNGNIWRRKWWEHYILLNDLLDRSLTVPGVGGMW